MVFCLFNGLSGAAAPLKGFAITPIPVAAHPLKGLQLLAGPFVSLIATGNHQVGAPPFLGLVESPLLILISFLLRLRPPLGVKLPMNGRLRPFDHLPMGKGGNDRQHDAEGKSPDPQAAGRGGICVVKGIGSGDPIREDFWMWIPAEKGNEEGQSQSPVSYQVSLSMAGVDVLKNLASSARTRRMSCFSPARPSISTR